MKMETVHYNMTAKDLFNAKSSSKKVCDYIGVSLTATGCATAEEIDVNGEVKVIGYIATNEGVFGFTSSVLIGAIPDLAEYMRDTGDPTIIEFTSNASNAGKTFYSVEIK